MLALAAAARLVAQEPRPVRLDQSSFGSGDVTLDFAWRYAAGDDAARASAAFDDSRWTPLRPALEALAPSWNGVGWFRRHLVVAPDLQSKPIAIRLTGPGAARLYVDGREVLAMGDAAAPEIPATRSDAAMIRFDGAPHVLAVRYVYPPNAPRPGDIGFRVTLGEGGGVSTTLRPEWTIALRGAVFALPLFLAFLHFALFAFDRRARENLFYALEMLVFALLVLHQYEQILLATNAQRAALDTIGNGLPSLAILFGGLTYFALRANPWPKTWRLFVVAGIVLYGCGQLHGIVFDYAWMPYFIALIVEIVRVERGRTVVKRKQARFYVVSFALFGATIVLQVLVDFNVVPPIAGIREVYVFGIIVSAIGMSLYLASTLGQSRIHELENRRKTAELTQARELQLSMLPRVMPRVARLDVAAATQPAAEVGGDYYDVRRASDGELLFAFGDATGHGLSAGIVVTAAKALFTSLDADGSPAALLGVCDRAMGAMHLPTLRMCLALARVSPQRVTIASAAMPPLLIRRASTGAIDELGAGALPLGSRIAAAYEERTTSLAPGDTLLFASDGFAELPDADDVQLGYDGVARAFARAGGVATAAEVVEQLLARVERQTDDVTFVVVRIA